MSERKALENAEPISGDFRRILRRKTNTEIRFSNTNIIDPVNHWSLWLRLWFPYGYRRWCHICTFRKCSNFFILFEDSYQSPKLVEFKNVVFSIWLVVAQDHVTVQASILGGWNCYQQLNQQLPLLLMKLESWVIRERYQRASVCIILPIILWTCFLSSRKERVISFRFPMGNFWLVSRKGDGVKIPVRGLE